MALDFCFISRSHGPWPTTFNVLGRLSEAVSSAKERLGLRLVKLGQLDRTVGRAMGSGQGKSPMTSALARRMKGLHNDGEGTIGEVKSGEKGGELDGVAKGKLGRNSRFSLAAFSAVRGPQGGRTFVPIGVADSSDNSWIGDLTGKAQLRSYLVQNLSSILLPLVKSHC